MCKAPAILSGLREFQVPKNKEIVKTQIAHPFGGFAKNGPFFAGQAGVKLIREPRAGKVSASKWLLSSGAGSIASGKSS